MSAPPPKAVITGVGAVTAVGLSASATAAAVRAGIARFGELEEIFDDMGELVVAAAAPLESPETEDRLSCLLKRATEEALTSAGYAGQSGRPAVALFLVAPDPKCPDGQPEHLKRRWEGLLEGIGERVAVHAKETIAGGHAGFFLALAKAIELFDKNVCTTVLIGAADSLIAPPVLDWLEDQGRLKTSYTPKGLVPGEAATMVVVERAPYAPPPQTRVWAQCYGVGTASEPVNRESEEPLAATGLTDALQGALGQAGLAPKDIEVVLCDLNGEPYRFNEWAMARNRVLGRAGDLDIWHPVDALGDTGAATGGILTVLASVGLTRGYWKCGRVLLWTSADSGERAAFGMTQPPAVVGAKV